MGTILARRVALFRAVSYIAADPAAQSGGEGAGEHVCAKVRGGEADQSTGGRSAGERGGTRERKPEAVYAVAHIRSRAHYARFSGGDRRSHSDHFELRTQMAPGCRAGEPPRRADPGPEKCGGCHHGGGSYHAQRGLPAQACRCADGKGRHESDPGSHHEERARCTTCNDQYQRHHGALRLETEEIREVREQCAAAGERAGQLLDDALRLQRVRRLRRYPAAIASPTDSSGWAAMYFAVVSRNLSRPLARVAASSSIH